MGKRDLLYGQKRPTTWAKETYLEFLSAALASHVAVLSVSNMRQKRPTIWAKETYYMPHMYIGNVQRNNGEESQDTEPEP
jgi:hypothetical protein